jgi:hypothetical protein
MQKTNHEKLCSSIEIKRFLNEKQNAIEKNG